MPFEDNAILLCKTVETISDVIDIPPHYRVGYFISRCEDSRSVNEDSLFIIKTENGLCFGVADGAGGHPKGDEASTIAAETIVEYFKNNQSNSPNILELIEEVNNRVISLKVGAHSTLCIGYIEDHHIRCHNVGDSEVIFWNSAGNELYSNIPHSHVGYLIETGMIHQTESLDNPQRHQVSNLIGDTSIRIESTTKMELKKGNSILIGSDGLFDNIPHKELQSILTKGSFESAFQELKQICIDKNPERWKKMDDLSFIFLRKIAAENRSTEK